MKCDWISLLHMMYHRGYAHYVSLHMNSLQEHLRKANPEMKDHEDRQNVSRRNWQSEACLVGKGMC